MRLLTRSALGLYKALWTAAKPLARRHKRLREGFGERITLTDEPFTDQRPTGSGGPLIWIQAASGGEAALVRSLLRAVGELPALCARNPRFFCTTWTAQGLEVLRRITPPAECSLLARHFPLDDPTLMRQAVALARPACVVLLETELWPGLMAACRESNTPLLVLNARMTPKSLGGYRLLRSLWRDIRPDRILAVSRDDAARFADIFGPEDVATMPNIKFDGACDSLPKGACKARGTDVADVEGAGGGIEADGATAVTGGEEAIEPNPVGADPFAALPAGRDPRIPRLALASVRQEEEELLLGILSRLTAGGAALAVAPRHMHRVDFWRKALAEHQPVLRSELLAGVTPPCEQSPIIWDTFGDLALLYAHVDAAFVGGSLAPLGGQNFLEAPALGAHALVGPHLANFHWVGEEIFQTGTVRRLQSADELPQAVAAISEERSQVGRTQAAADVRRRFAEWLAPRTGGAHAAAAAVAEALSRT